MADQEEIRQQAVPVFYASSIRVMTTGNDMKLALGDVLPADDSDGSGEIRQQAAIITMSLHTAKDLHALLGRGLEETEEMFGAIDTPFLRHLRNEKPG